MENSVQPKPENLAQSSASLTNGAEPVLAYECGIDECGDLVPCYPNDPPSRIPPGLPTDRPDSCC